MSQNTGHKELSVCDSSKSGIGFPCVRGNRIVTSLVLALMIFPLLTISVGGSLILRVRMSTGGWPQSPSAAQQSFYDMISSAEARSTLQRLPSVTAQDLEGSRLEVADTMEALFENMPDFDKPQMLPPSHYGFHGHTSQFLAYSFTGSFLFAIAFFLLALREVGIRRSLICCGIWISSLAIMLAGKRIWFDWLMD